MLLKDVRPKAAHVLSIGLDLKVWCYGFGYIHGNDGGESIPVRTGGLLCIANTRVTLKYTRSLLASKG